LSMARRFPCPTRSPWEHLAWPQNIPTAWRCLIASKQRISPPAQQISVFRPPRRGDFSDELRGYGVLVRSSQALKDRETQTLGAQLIESDSRLSPTRRVKEWVVVVNGKNPAPEAARRFQIVVDRSFPDQFTGGDGNRGAGDVGEPRRLPRGLRFLAAT